MQEVDELMRKQEKLVQAAIRENEESELRVLRKNEERVEGLKRENKEREEKLKTEMKEREVKLKEEYETALAQLGILKRERGEDLRKELALADEQLRRENVELEEKQRRKNEESLALLLTENEAQITNTIARQEEEERVGREKKVDQLETTAMKQPAAPECPVNRMITFTF